ncbi:MAG: hypothetical protein LBQ81_02080 [Zoogloeaceae bacterium]|jgi:hypothetical protein|nr:hypothetical protein [Zoogloeaceae bacterium]
MESASFGMHAAAFAVPFPVTSGIALAAHEVDDRAQETDDREKLTTVAPQTPDPLLPDL